MKKICLRHWYRNMMKDKRIIKWEIGQQHPPFFQNAHSGDKVPPVSLVNYDPLVSTSLSLIPLFLSSSLYCHCSVVQRSLSVGDSDRLAFYFLGTFVHIIIHMPAQTSHRVVMLPHNCYQFIENTLASSCPLRQMSWPAVERCSPDSTTHQLSAGRPVSRRVPPYKILALPQQRSESWWSLCQWIAIDSVGFAPFSTRMLKSYILISYCNWISEVLQQGSFSKVIPSSKKL
jgi:hypothetical protein